MRLIASLALCASLFELSSGLGGARPAAKPDLHTSPYYIWPKVATDQTANKKILAQLTKASPADNTISISQVGADQSSVNFWLVSLSEADASALNDTSSIAIVAPKCTNDCREIVEDLPSGPSQTSNKPPSIVQRANDPGFITQAGAQPEMVFISQPRILGTGGVPLGNLNGRYVYDSSAGIGTTVYMIDSGADDRNAEFVDIEPAWRWMGPNYFRGPGGTYMNAGQVGDWPTDSHGTSILSKISGKHFGASKKIKAVIVRHALVWTTSDVVEAVTWIINDWISIRSSISHTVKVAVINMSFHDQVGQHYKATSRADLVAFTRLRNLLNMAVAEGILPICSAGNDGQPVSGYPAMYGGLNNWDPSVNNGADFTAPPVPELLVVGGTDNNGRIWTGSSTGNFVEIYAPGVDIQMARLGTTPGQASGTSASCGTVSGLAAYWAALPSFSSRWNHQTPWPQRVTDLRNQLLSMTYSRLPGNNAHPAAVWNGVTANDNR